MRYNYLFILFIFFSACQKREEFRTFPEVNLTSEAALNHNAGLYFSKGKINDIAFDTINIVLSKSSGNQVQLSSPLFPSVVFAVNSLTDYSTHATPGGAGLDLISASPEVEFSIINSNMVLKYRKSNFTIDLVGKKIQ